MTERRSGARTTTAMTQLEDELTERLNRVHELGERLKRVNASVQRELERTNELAASLRGAAKEL
jgi:hypothetical protein